MQSSKKNTEAPGAAKAPDAKADVKGDGSKKKSMLGGETDPAAAEKKLAPGADAKADSKKTKGAP